MSNKDNKNNKDQNYHLGLGIGVGIAIGTGLGVLFDNIAIGSGLGMFLGIIIGGLIDRNTIDVKKDLVKISLITILGLIIILLIPVLVSYF